MVDEFAKYAKLKRKYNKLQDEAKGKSEYWSFLLELWLTIDVILHFSKWSVGLEIKDTIGTHVRDSCFECK